MEEPPKAVFVDPMAVTWTDKYAKTLDRVWSKLPNFLGSFIATVAVFLLGASIRGDHYRFRFSCTPLLTEQRFPTADWLLILVHFIKYLRNGESSGNSTQADDDGQVPDMFNEFSLKDYRLEGLPYFLIPAITVSFTIYLGVGGFLHWYYYVRQRDRPHEWKCQPNKWLSPELERHEIILGSTSLICGSLISGTLSCYIMNGGWTYIYYDFSQYGWLWAILQWPAIFIWQVKSVTAFGTLACAH